MDSTGPQPEHTPQSEDPSRGDTRPRVREANAREAEPDTPATASRPRSTADEARARKLARDAAYGWAAAMRKTDKRADEWAQEMQRARVAGALPGVLRDYITEAADRVGIEPAEVPHAVWQAADLKPPSR